MIANIRTRRLMPHLLLIPLVALWVYPFVWMISSAFKTRSELFLGGASIIPDEPILENFSRAWTDAEFGRYTLNTVIMSVSVVVLVVLIASTSGYVLGRSHLPGKKIIIGVLVLSMFMPSGYTIIPTFVLVDAIGLNNTMAGVVLATGAPGNVIAILLFMGYFKGLPDELEQAAIIDGASYPRIFWSVMLPLALPVIGTVTLFNFISAWNAFFRPLVFTLGAPDLRTLGVGMYTFFGENTTDWGGLAAAAAISVIPVVLVFLAVQRTFIEGIAGAVKN